MRLVILTDASSGRSIYVNPDLVRLVERIGKSATIKFDDAYSVEVTQTQEETFRLLTGAGGAA